ncbi:uncharacterized protein DFL_001248 [Arthrobotrys flagrans]|uniref:CN hydrolase domain-containing protein n=1 Tax=Arthrobotrys flagrans TaxID=97331 RepID=A0A437AGK2_ARTFL|nr:hypothetical protein DFL_001248 [Arthrobotrys flagrans]
MKIACLQFNPQIGKVQDNIHKADEILGNSLGIEDIQDKVDVLVLPELAFTGYVFESKASIRPYLERTVSGISTQWAQQTSRKLRCYTVVGYPELANEYKPPIRYPRASDIDPFSETPINYDDEDSDDDNIQNYCYNACVVTSPDGGVVTNYRKTFLYVTDELWASEGSSFGTTTFTFPTNPPASSPTSQKHIIVALGICMDLNPYKFEAPFRAYEFANHIISSGAQLAIVPMAWETKDFYDLSLLQTNAKVMHHSTVNYWVKRLEPLFGTDELESEEDDDDDGDDDEEEGLREWEYVGKDKGEMEPPKEQEELVFVTCNRTGREDGTLFVGSSVIMRIKKKDVPKRGRLENYQAMGMAEEGLMVVEVDI